MLHTFIKGASYPFTGLRWLTRPRLRSFVVIPLLVNVTLFGTAIWWGINEFSILLERTFSHLPTWLDWLRWLLWPLFAVTILLVIFYTFTLVANLIASPFNSILAKHVEDLVKPDSRYPEGKPLWQEIILAPLTELKKLAYFILWTIPLLLLFFIPGINAIAPLLWAAFGAWMLTLQYVDYPMGNHNILFREQRRILARRRWLALGFGGAVLVITMVPIVNFLAMPAAVIGATLMWVEQFNPTGRPTPAMLS